MDSSSKVNAASPAPIFVREPRPLATIATIATPQLQNVNVVVRTPAPDYRAGLSTFEKTRQYDATRFRHEQACWAAEMFLNEWQVIAAEFGWTPGNIFDRDGLANWLGTELVTALGPEHAITESGRAYDRMTRATWVNSYDGHTLQ